MLVITETDLELRLLTMLLRYRPQSHDEYPRFYQPEEMRKDRSSGHLLSQLMHLMGKRWFHEVVYRYTLNDQHPCSDEVMQQLASLSTVIDASRSLLIDRLCIQISDRLIYQLLSTLSTYLQCSEQGGDLTLLWPMRLATNHHALFVELNEAHIDIAHKRAGISRMLTELLVLPLMPLTQASERLFVEQRETRKSIQFAIQAHRKGLALLPPLLLQHFSQSELLRVFESIKSHCSDCGSHQSEEVANKCHFIQDSHFGYQMAQ